MYEKKLTVVLFEIERFQHRLAAYREAVRTGSCLSELPKQTGALRRASMDLTRALAELRKP